jgi:hypothetical protein
MKANQRIVEPIAHYPHLALSPMSVYTARAVTKQARPTPAFSTRNITDVTQAKLGEITILTVPHFPQLALLCTLYSVPRTMLLSANLSVPYVASSENAKRLDYGED